MKKIVKYLVALVLVPLWSNAQQPAPAKAVQFSFPDISDPWRIRQKVSYAIGETENFFGKPFVTVFNVNVYPTRAALDKQWQTDWGTPHFKSECWMVASGVGPKLDLLSPERWKTEACEHDASDTIKMQKLITHEVVHVFHGQLNPSHDFSDVLGLDWLVEGVATYASGQLDDKRLNDLKVLQRENKIPASLDDFWKGKHKYGLSGGLVRYIDQKYGRDILVKMLSFTRRDQATGALNISEASLIEDFKRYIQTL